jgi:hypothetical protein
MIVLSPPNAEYSRSALMEHPDASMALVAQFRAQVLCSSHVSVLDLCQYEASVVAPPHNFYQGGINTKNHVSKQFDVD